MATTPEVAIASRLLVAAADRLFAAAEGLDTEELNWSPFSNASSISALGLHVIGATRENVLTHICRIADSDRIRATEFEPSEETGSSLASRWAALRPEIEAALEALPTEALDAPRNHQTFGEVPARELLLRLVGHVYEHAAHAELTHQLLEERRQNIPA